MDDVVIFGAGNLGKTAYYFYKDKCNIICYIDNDVEKWGTFLFEKEVVSPEILWKFKGRVIIAVQNNFEQIETELQSKYGINRFLEFGVTQKGKILGGEQLFDNRCIIMVYTGGLGNQLFQYSLAKYFEVNGCKVTADITHYMYIKSRKFELNRIFRNIHLKFATDNTYEYYVLKDKVSKIEGLNEKYVYVEPDIKNFKQYDVSDEWGNINRGIVKGYFQTYLFADGLRDTLLKCFEFPVISNKGLQELIDGMMNKNSVSVHVRRGDYLTEKERRLNGICDMQYYIRAIKMIKERVKNPQFYIFSDDIVWCKENFKIKESIYIESEMIENYEDWQDMYLMSRCKHNIIANSSFSWWGAWLNENERKIVIAPKRWDNFCNLTNICPPTWWRI